MDRYSTSELLSELLLVGDYVGRSLSFAEAIDIVPYTVLAGMVHKGLGGS